jgi:hypothetical protein
MADTTPKKSKPERLARYVDFRYACLPQPLLLLLYGNELTLRLIASPM